MLKRLLDSLKRNLLLKIISILIAIVIWYVVVDYNDPVETASFTVKIKVANESYIANGKQSYRIDDAYKTVTVYVKGNRSRLKNVDAEDIVVTADLTQIVDLDKTPVMVPLTASVSGFTAASITLSRTAIPITIENISSKEFPVTVDTGNSSPGQNFEVGTMTPDPEQIIVNGPESIVNEIDSIIAEIDVTGMTQDGTKKATLKLLDKNSAEISQETIDDDLTFDGGVPDVTVQVDLWRKQSNVALHVDYSGEPADGYRVTGTSTTPETITVAGTEAALSTLAADGNTISIPEDMISIDGESQDVTKELKLSDILPTDLIAASSMADTITVHITILENGSRELNLDVDNINTSGLSQNLTVSYDQTELTIRVEGTESVVQDLSGDDIKATIDLSGKEAGNYTVPVSVTLPDGVSLVDSNITIPVHLKTKAK